MATLEVSQPVAPVLDRVSQLVDAKPQAFITGDKDLVNAALEATKYIFDLSLQKESHARSFIAELIRSYDPSTKPVTRSQAKAAAEKDHSPTPTPQPDHEIWKPTPVDSLLLDGMDDEQVWAQLELRTANLCETLKNILEYDPVVDEDEDIESDGSGAEGSEDDEELEFEGFEDGEEGEAAENEDIETDEEDDSLDGKYFPEEIMSLHDPSDEETEEGEENDDEDEESRMDIDDFPSSKSKSVSLSASSPKSKPVLKKAKGSHPILDDGFFSLADFKAEVEEAEAKKVSRGRLGDDEDEDEELEDDIDLFAPVNDENFDEEDMDTGEPYYNDFFVPPKNYKDKVKSKSNGKRKIVIPKPKKSSLVRFNDEVKVRKIKGVGRGLPVNALTWQDGDEEEDEEVGDFGEEFDDEDDEEDEDGQGEEEEEDDDDGSQSDEDEGRNAIERFKDDLFADDDEKEGPLKDLSTHEARLAEIAAQIKELEGENVAPKPWILMGEATTRSRPVNSLLEEDLEFDRVLKAVPVITEESVNTLEEMIKKRILDNMFDDVVRKRPVEDKPFLPSRLFELDDKKSSKGLAEIYADEYTAAASGTSIDVRDENLKKQHEEIVQLWDSICYKLDALSNAHFTPKPPKATISTISNVAAASLESALPTTVSTTTMLAPEEIYAPKTSDLRSKEEMTPLEKRTLRNKQRKTRKKAQDMIKSATGNVAQAQGSRSKPFGKSLKKEKEKALKSIVKTGKGVTVVGKQDNRKEMDKRTNSKGLKL
ncbi:hypothetical protein Clacol_003884 [Clathrus columnatus]|uniref:U3 small nucleolar ribonucleoprotein protein MPP10 n=1 Tax=Clathrus columnatus TaxID=1419009 RepID=A0AAV5A5U4_9AGAM|nr:hypothetical protein Clacol_003884 [Clathrus columnatus]